MLTLCSFKIDVFLRLFLRTWKFATSESMFRARLPSIFITSHKMPRLPRNLQTILPKLSFYQRAVLVFWAVSMLCQQAWDFRDILKSDTWLCVTGAGHRTFFWSTWQACALRKRWSKWEAVLEIIFFGCFVKLDRWFGTWWWFRVGCSTSDASGSFVVAGVVLCRPLKHAVPE